MQARYTIEAKGLLNIEAIEGIRRVLQVYVNDLADCFGLVITVDVDNWSTDGLESVSLPLQKVPLPDAGSGQE
jgi:hypothetical protein